MERHLDAVYNVLRRSQLVKTNCFYVLYLNEYGGSRTCNEVYMEILKLNKAAEVNIMNLFTFTRLHQPYHHVEVEISWA